MAEEKWFDVSVTETSETVYKVKALDEQQADDIVACMLAGGRSVPGRLGDVTVSTSVSEGDEPDEGDVVEFGGRGNEPLKKFTVYVSCCPCVSVDVMAKSAEDAENAVGEMFDSCVGISVKTKDGRTLPGCVGSIESVEAEEQ